MRNGDYLLPGQRHLVDDQLLEARHDALKLSQSFGATERQADVLQQITDLEAEAAELDAMLGSRRSQARGAAEIAVAAKFGGDHGSRRVTAMHELRNKLHGCECPLPR